MQHKPLQVLACVAGDTRLEDIVTISLMSKFGWERVRGGRWCQLALEGPPDAVMRGSLDQIRATGMLRRTAGRAPPRGARLRTASLHLPSLESKRCRESAR